MSIQSQLKNRTNIKKNLDEQKQAKEITIEPVNVVDSKDLIPEVKRSRAKITPESFKGEEKRRLSVDVPSTMFKAIGLYCANNETTRAELTLNLFIKFLSKEGYLK